MVDQQQSTRSSQGAISAMANDLAQLKSDPQKAPSAIPATRRSAAPINLPTAQAKPIPAAAPPKNAPIPAPRPALPPMPPPQVAIKPTPPQPVRPPTPAPLPVPPKALQSTSNSDEASSYATELRTMRADVSNIQVGRPPAGIPQSAPQTVPTPPRAPQTQQPAQPIVIVPPAPQQPRIAVPPPPESAPTSSRPRNILIGVFLLALMLAGGAYMLTRNNGSEVVSSPTPSSIAYATPTPVVAGSLASYFGTPIGSVTIGTEHPAQDVANTVTQLSTPSQTFGTLVIQSTQVYQAKELIKALLPSAPDTLISALGDDTTIFAYGQSEFFDQAGQAIPSSTVHGQIVTAFEVKDASAVNQAMQSWETAQGAASIVTDGSVLFGYDASKHIVAGFTPGTYRTIPLRYWNFPYADHSIDWAVVLGPNGKSYLLLAGSRSSLYSAIDHLIQ